MKSIVITGLGIIVIMLSSPIRAETTAEALRAFGLVGTWSPDCAKETAKGGERSTILVPTLGEPTIESIGHYGPDNRFTTISHFLIKSAIRVTEEKLKYSPPQSI